jgi:hypothetical protein
VRPPLLFIYFFFAAAVFRLHLLITVGDNYMNVKVKCEVCSCLLRSDDLRNLDASRIIGEVTCEVLNFSELVKVKLSLVLDLQCSATLFLTLAVDGSE